MAKSSEHKCNYKGCTHPEDMIPTGEGTVISRHYYHTDCARKMECIKEVRSFYVENVSDTVVMSYLNKVINGIVYDKHVDPEFLLFALKFAMSHNQRIKAPAGLYYIIDNSRIKEEYNKESQKTVAHKVSVKIDDGFDFSTKPVVVQPPKKKGFADIFGGGITDE